MESNDKPDDLQRETLIDNEIKKGETDEKASKSKLRNVKSHTEGKKNGKITQSIRKEEWCRAKKLSAIETTKGPKTVKVLVYEKPCTLSKRKPQIPRHCMSKQEWIDLLATPSRKCPPSSMKKTEVRNLRAIPARINELAQPMRQRMIATLQDRGATLPAPLVDRLINALESESCLTPEQAETLFLADRKKKKRNKVKKVDSRRKNTVLKQSINQVEKRPILDKDTVTCQYLMAETFVKSILQWKCSIPREEFKDMSDVILRRLQCLFNYETLVLNEDDRTNQQMRFIADIIASWIAGVLFEVAELKQDELEKDCEEMQQAMEENDEDDDDDDDNNGNVLDIITTTDDYSTDQDDDDHDGNDHDAGDGNGGHRDHHDNDDDDGENSEKAVFDAENDIKEVKGDDIQSEIKPEPEKSIEENMEAIVKLPDEIQDEGINYKIIAATGSMPPEVEHQVYKQTSTITQQDNWHGWTSSVEPAVLFPRRIYLDSIYQDLDYNRTTLSGHDVVKSSQTKYPQYSILEREIDTPEF